MKVMEFRSKATEVPFWEAGGFGNKLRSWPSLAAFERDGQPCNATIMYISGRGGSGRCEYGIPSDKVASRVRTWISEGEDPRRIVIRETAPDHRLLVNGELSDDWSFYHSRLRLPMREALRKGGMHAAGFRVRYMLRCFMTPASWEDLLALMGLYPDHVIELSVYEMLLGNLRGRNTIVWEVRKY